LNLAVPVDGVPVGLSLMNSEAADGTVSIEKAKTIGIDTVSMWKQLTIWASDNAVFLSQYAPSGKITNYVRVVTRVYAAGQMNVSLRDASSQSGGLDVGAAKPVNLLFPQLTTNNSAEVANTFTNQVNLLGVYTNGLNAIQQSLPGGSVRIAAASSRTVAMQQDFVPPLVVGYLGFDCEILDGGELGPPMPTHARLNKENLAGHHKIVSSFGKNLSQQTADFLIISNSYTAASADQQRRIRAAALDARLSSDGDSSHWLKGLSDIVNGNDAVKTAEFSELKTNVLTIVGQKSANNSK